jgi:hypothetical protein
MLTALSSSFGGTNDLTCSLAGSSLPILKPNSLIAIFYSLSIRKGGVIAPH